MKIKIYIFVHTHVCHCTHMWVCNWISSVLKASTSVDSTLLKECHLDLHDYHVTCFCDVDSLDSMCQIRWHLYLVYFSECNVFSVHPCCCKWHYIFFSICALMEFSSIPCLATGLVLPQIREYTYLFNTLISFSLHIYICSCGVVLYV